MFHVDFKVHCKLDKATSLSVDGCLLPIPNICLILYVFCLNLLTFVTFKFANRRRHTVIQIMVIPEKEKKKNAENIRQISHIKMTTIMPFNFFVWIISLII